MLKADRLAAFVRGTWRILAAAVFWGPAYLIITRGVDWSVTWRTDRASCLALGAVVGLLLLPGLLLALAASRWYLLALRPGFAGFHWAADRLMVRLGPFGRADLDVERLSLKGLDADLDLDDIDPEVFLPALRHPDYPGDLLADMLIYVNMPVASLWNAIRDRLPPIEHEHVAPRRQL